jgi:hypothetical protein
MIHLRDNYWAVEVPDPQHAVISGNTITWSANGAQGRGFIALPPGTWDIVCTSKATEEQAASIVERDGELYLDYVSFRGLQNYTDNPLESLKSILTSKGCDLNKTYLILKKIA